MVKMMLSPLHLLAAVVALALLPLILLSDLLRGMSTRDSLFTRLTVSVEYVPLRAARLTVFFQMLSTGLLILALSLAFTLSISITISSCVFCTLYLMCPDIQSSCRSSFFKMLLTDALPDFRVTPIIVSSTRPMQFGVLLAQLNTILSPAFFARCLPPIFSSPMEKLSGCRKDTFASSATPETFRNVRACIWMGRCIMLVTCLANTLLALIIQSVFISGMIKELKCSGMPAIIFRACATTFQRGIVRGYNVIHSSMDLQLRLSGLDMWGVTSASHIVIFTSSLYHEAASNASLGDCWTMDRHVRVEFMVLSPTP